jgi:hypothetical protein
MTALALIGLQLAACVTSSDGANTPARNQLPPVPADILLCLRSSASVPPDRDLTAGDVEELWKKDRVKIVVLKKCGNRFTAWYNSLRQSWD